MTFSSSQARSVLLSCCPPRPFGRVLWAMAQPALAREYGRKAGTCIGAPCADSPTSTVTGSTPTWCSGRSATGSTARPVHGTAPVPRGRDTGDRPVPDGSEGLDPGGIFHHLPVALVRGGRARRRAECGGPAPWRLAGVPAPRGGDLRSLDRIESLLPFGSFAAMSHHCGHGERS